MIPLLLLSLALADAGQDVPLEPGTYRLDAVLATQSKAPFVGRVTVYNRSAVLVHLERGADGWTQRQRLCAVTVDDDVKMSTTTVPLAFVQATPVQTYPVRFEPTSDGWRYTADPGPLDVGWDRAAAAGVLPEHPDDPGVLDFEGDGRPGATVLLDVPVFKEVEVYVVQTGHSAYEGRIVDGRVEGSLVVRGLQQNTIDASNKWFRATPPVTVLPEQSTITLVRVPDDTTCADLR